MNPMWKVYKSKVMKTFNQEMEEEAVEEVSETAEDLTPVPSDEGPSAVTQLAKRMQGAGAKGWKSVSSLFTKDDEHQLLEAENQPAADHPLAVKPEEPPRPGKRNTGFWDNFATKWQQGAAMRQAEAEAEDGAEGGGQNDSGESGGANMAQDGETQEGEAGAGNSFSRYATLTGDGDETPAFKWNFVTSKLAELKSRGMAKSN